ncbi:glycine cleavage system protein GcvH [Reinekea marinisedimentorum]|uniref:Glycine cleavage system H protein n=1 Tax=Reinekea marinisedimentorum TaxID=230495 RepID=A0A4R3I6J1_9GAMM|nr:glycine cleavage system protein GcvH [Reinekea marinisedimentorum]TCS40433.1 glycine cleavage system H protein [Reinekea marinisedimentorum]
MSEVIEKLLYSESHEWVRREADGTVTVGLSDHAQKALGDVVYVELPEVGSEVNMQDEVALVESVKAASDVYTPISGEVLAINDVLADEPQIINESCYDNGWLFKLKPADEAELDSLLSAAAYAEQTEE